MKPLAPIPDISVRIGAQEIPLQARLGSIVALLARHQAALTTGNVKIVLDCSPSSVELVVQTKLGRVKVKR